MPGFVSPVIHITLLRRKLARWMVDQAGNARNEGGVERHSGEAAGEPQRGQVWPRRNAGAQGAPRYTLAVGNVGAKKRKASKSAARNAGEDSGTAASATRRNEPIRQKVIGRAMAVGGRRFRGSGFFDGRMDRELALLDEPASEIGSGVFLEPLIEQGSDFLTQIGGMSEAGELVGLKRIAGSGEKKFPGSLGAGLGHDNLQNRVREKYRSNNNHRVIDGASDVCRTDLWKRVEKKENSAGCCSGCGGDYEDPDWTAWEADLAEDEEVEEGGEGTGSGSNDRRV